MVEIEFLENNYRYQATYTLDDQVVTLYLDWNDRVKAWFLSFLDENDEIIVSGVRLIPGIALATDYRYDYRLPRGFFFLYDIEQDPATSAVTEDNIGTRYRLYYYGLKD